MAAKVVPNVSKNIVIAIEPDRLIPRQKKPPEEESEKKAVQTIYEQLKQIACCQNREKTEERWRQLIEIFKSSKYKENEKAIFEKLDDINNYAVLSNIRFIYEKLLNEYKCNVNLLGWDGQTPLHLAACSSQIEEEEESNMLGNEDEVN